MAAYNYKLLKDMAEMKEKILLYETIEGDLSSFHDSKNSGELNRSQDIDSPIVRLAERAKSPQMAFKKV